MLLVYFLEREATIDAAVCGATLECLQALIKCHCPALLKKGMSPHDNAHSYMAVSIWEFLQHFQ